MCVNMEIKLSCIVIVALGLVAQDICLQNMPMFQNIYNLRPKSKSIFWMEHAKYTLFKTIHSNYLKLQSKYLQCFECIRNYIFCLA